jgi:isoleucyl-tRNA synthetase
LVRLSIILAPFVPFLAEELYLKLTGGEAGESVHLLDWPKAGVVDENGLAQMAELRELINQGLSLRAASKLKVRQPLASAKLYSTVELAEALQEIALEELNVKAVQVATVSQKDATAKVELDTNITPELKREGYMREVIRLVQNARKDAGLNVDDRIQLSLQTDDAELQQAIGEHAAAIQAETLATALGDIQEGYTVAAKVEDHMLTIMLTKA